MDIELEKLKKLEHALCDAIDILRDWQVEEAKPEEEKWIAYLARFQDGLTLCRCDESYWEFAKEFDGAKTKLFVGSKDEAREWCKNRERFAYVIKAWEDGKEIQFYSLMQRKWETLNNPSWDCNWEYRVKPECPCEDGIDSKACVGCEHSEDGKRKYKPYVTVDEFIQDFQERFPTAFPRPAFSMPLVWVRGRENGVIYLIDAFGKDHVRLDSIRPVRNFCQLFEYYAYLDGSPCGMEEKE